MYHLYNHHQIWDTETYLDYLYSVQESFFSKRNRTQRPQSQTSTFRRNRDNSNTLHSPSFRELFQKSNHAMKYASASQNEQPTTLDGAQFQRSDSRHSTSGHFGGSPYSTRNSSNAFGYSSYPEQSNFSRHATPLLSSDYLNNDSPKRSNTMTPNAQRSASTCGRPLKNPTLSRLDHPVTPESRLAAVERVCRYRNRLHQYASFNCGPTQMLSTGGRSVPLQRRMSRVNLPVG